MAVDMLTDTVIRCPRGDVASYAANPDHVRNWYANIREVEWKTTPPVAVGSQVAFVAQFLGRRLAYTYEVVVLELGTRLVMRTSEGPFPMETSYTWETTPEDFTRMTLRNRGTPTGFLTSHGAVHGMGDAAGQPEGSGLSEGPARGACPPADEERPNPRPI